MKVSDQRRIVCAYGRLFILALLVGCTAKQGEPLPDSKKTASRLTDQNRDTRNAKETESSHTGSASSHSNSVPIPVAAPPVNNLDYALSFDGKDDYVKIPTLKYDGSHPLTIELTATPRSIRPEKPNTRLDRTPTLVGDWGWTLKGFGIIVRADNFRWGIGFHNEKNQRYVNAESTAPGECQRRVNIAGTFDGTTSRLFIDGRLVGVSKAVEEYGPSGLPLLIGASWKVGNEFENHFKGILDEMRISNIARYSEDYSPARRLVVDAHTLALYHFDEEDGDLLKDESPHKNDGKIVGASRVSVDAVVASPLGKAGP